MKSDSLTSCEEMVMKTLWDADKELSVADITRQVNETYHRDWKPQTVSTFLTRLAERGYVSHYRRGRAFIYQILVPKEVYLEKQAERFAAFWKRDDVEIFLEQLRERM